MKLYLVEYRYDDTSSYYYYSTFHADDIEHVREQFNNSWGKTKDDPEIIDAIYECNVVWKEPTDEA